MKITEDILVTKVIHSKLHEVDFSELEFGKYVADHMLICNYENGSWAEPEILPYEELSLAPTALALHYGQTVFEGMKAFRMQDGRISIFRLDRHYQRLAVSLDRMCMAVPPLYVFEEGLKTLIDLDRNWVPEKEGDALYLRPFVIATEEKFGVKISNKFKFIIFTGPVPAMYTKPIRVKVETQYIRAASGGTGFAKCGGNYGGAFYPTEMAKQAGYDQVLWTDSSKHQYIEESGVMNIMFVINNKIVTAPLSDTILDGITRESLLLLSSEMGFAAEIRPISISELEEAFASNEITEAFGVGTAAVVAPIKTIHINGIDYSLPEYNEKHIHMQLKRKMAQIRSGVIPDTFGWNTII